MTDPDFGTGFVAATGPTRFARDAVASDDAAPARERMDEIERQVDANAREVEEAGDGAFFEDVGSFFGADGGAPGPGDPATAFGHGAIEADPVGPPVELGPSAVDDPYSADDGGPGFELSQHLADAVSLPADVADRLGDPREHTHVGGGDDGAGSYADGVVAVTDDDDFDLFQA
jgi:hypothetical protein